MLLLAFCLSLFFFTSSEPVSENEELYAADDVLDFDHLRQYGDWIKDSTFGVVWRPCCIDSWRPFYYGHWIFTRFGWTWIGYEPFAWIASHYGSWFRKDQTEWVWIPSYEWSPAPVQWIQYEKWIAWTPIHGNVSKPWTNNGKQDWCLVDVKNFTREMVGFHLEPNYARPPSRASIREMIPNLDELARLSRERILIVDTTLESQLGSLKLVLPWSETEKIQRFRHSLWKKVLRPKAEEQKLPGGPEGGEQ